MAADSGVDFSEKLLNIGNGFAQAFAVPLPSFHPTDLCIGLMLGAVLRLAVHLKGKNAKKYRKNTEYGSARWGTAQDIQPYIDPVFENNIILTQTERLMMSGRPKNPANARNKNVLIVGGSGSGKTRFWIKPNLTMYDELELDTLGDEKTALFLIMSDTDATFNFLISMIYTQLFNLLCEKADDVYGGRLPVHVRCLIDECANIGQIPNLEKLVATIRSREISACLVLQAKKPAKGIYKDNADTIIGNMDSQIFLGGSEPGTLKDLSEMLGKKKRLMRTTLRIRVGTPHRMAQISKLGHELLSRDELAVLDGGKCILQLRGVRPFLSDKYDLTQHPNYKLTSGLRPQKHLRY